MEKESLLFGTLVLKIFISEGEKKMGIGFNVKDWDELEMEDEVVVDKKEDTKKDATDVAEKESK